MYKKLSHLVVAALVATVGLVGGTVSAQEVAAPSFDENGNSAIVTVTCESVTVELSHNRSNPQGNWLRSFYLGSGTLPSGTYTPGDPNLVDVLQGEVETRTVDSEDVIVRYFSGDRNLGANPGTWQPARGWVAVETTIVYENEDCPAPVVPSETETKTEEQVTVVPKGAVNAGNGASLATILALIGSITALGYGLFRLQKATR